MAFKVELYKGGELHYRARRQTRYFVGLLIVGCILCAVGAFNDPSFFDGAVVLFAELWCLSLPLIFNGAVCEAYAEEKKADMLRWYYVSFIAALVIPSLASIAAVIITGAIAYLLVFVIACFFVLRNHRLLKALLD